MSKDNKEQQVDQLLRGIYRTCVNKDDCSDCPFYITKCMFEEPKPRTWFDEDTIEIQPAPEVAETADNEVAKEPAEVAKTPEVADQPEEKKEISEEPAAEESKEEPAAQETKAEEPKKEDDTEGTWLVSTTMGSVFTKYVFICSKCGYRKESIFSMTPMTTCPECAKKKAGLIQ